MTKKRLMEKMLEAGTDGRAKRKTRERKAEGERIGWSVLTLEEQERPGAQLLAMIYTEANNRGIPLKELADELGVTYGYIAQLRAGVREVRHISDEFATAAAKFLGCPRIDVLLAAGRVKREDFLSEPDNLDTQLRNAIEFLGRDSTWRKWVTPHVFECPREVQWLVVRLYEEATGRKLVTAPGLEQAR